jgi:hypothetical protein
MIYHDIGRFKMDSQMIHRSIFRQIYMNLIEGDRFFAVLLLFYLKLQDGSGWAQDRIASQ